jgi:hypothetical protein
MSSSSRVVLMHPSGKRDRHGGGHQDGSSSNSASTAHARVRLKLAALAYVGTRHGSDARAELLIAAISALCGSALAYYGSLTGKSWTRVEDRTLHWDAGSPADMSDVSDGDARVVSSRMRLKLACVSYESTRHGSDAHVEFTRAGIAELCGAAIHYCETLLGSGIGTGDAADAASGNVVDRTMHLDDGK